MSSSTDSAPAPSPRWSARSVSSALPDFPWDRLTSEGGRARAHADGIVDLSIGSPVDPTPEVVRRALADAADAPGYPLTIGRVDTRQACVDCGACEPVCPVEAIFYEDDTPEQWKEDYNANVDFFNDLGSPGGAAKMGVIDKDHPLVAELHIPQNQE